MENSILNNQKRFDNLYSDNENVNMIKPKKYHYEVIFYGKLAHVLFSSRGRGIVKI
jgi:hypothetical protein